MFSFIKVKHKGLILVLFPLVFELIFLLVLFQRLEALSKDFERLNHSQNVVYQLHSVVFGMLQGGAKFAAFDAQTPEERLKSAQIVEANFSRSGYLGEIDLSGADQFQELFADFETSRKLFLKVLRQYEEKAIAGGTSTYTNKDRDEIVMSMFTLNSLFDRIKSTYTRMDAAEPAKLNSMFETLVIVLLTGFILSCAVSFLVARVLTVDIVRRLEEISNKAYLVAAGRPLPAVQSGNDEIADLDKALHRAEKKLEELRRNEQAILNNTADIVCSLDRQLRFVAAADPVESNWGYKPDDLLGRSLLTLLDDDINNGVRKKFDEAQSSSSAKEIELALKCRGNYFRDLSWTVVWIEADECFACVVHDVTELKRLERLKETFFSMVSHDLRTPLAAITVNVENLRAEKDSEVYKNSKRLLDIISQSITRLGSLVDDLLELDKIDAGKLDLELTCISLLDVCETSIATLESMAQDAGIEIVPPRSDAAVMADERRLVQVVTNLISNAIKFSPRNSKVSLTVRSCGDSRVEVAVKDEGPGISANVQAALFDRYAMGDAATNVAIKGSGLGLAIVSSIIEAHGGTVGVESEEGKGASFWFRLDEFTDDAVQISSEGKL